MKKKIIWGIIILLVVGVIGWFDLPYILTTKNLISNQSIDYTYERIAFNNWEEEYSQPIEVRDETQMKNIISKIDALKLRRTKNISYGKDEIAFLGRYTNDKNMTIVEDVFTISFSKSDNDNILLFSRSGDFKVYSYKILNKDFDIEAFIKDLKGEEI